MKGPETETEIQDEKIGWTQEKGWNKYTSVALLESPKRDYCFMSDFQINGEAIKFRFVRKVIGLFNRSQKLTIRSDEQWEKKW